MTQFFHDLRWDTWTIYEFNDTQRLEDGTSSEGYGPTTSIFANPRLDKLTLPDYQADSGIIAAVVYVPLNAASLPDTYKDLGLQPDFTCVILNQDRTTGVWSAYSVKSDQTTCRNTTAPHTALAILPVTATAYPDSVPPVARFHLTQNGRMGFGVRCLVAWCELRKAGGFAMARAEHQDDPGDPHSAKSTVPGWFDDQRLAVLNGGSYKPRMRASIIPDDSIAIWDTLRYTVADGKHVASIFVRGTPPRKYYDKGYRKGWNDLFLKRDTLAADTLRWQARIVGRTSGHVGQWIKTLRTDHHIASDPTFKVPATARWAWWDGDEEIWVECDVGCCRVQTGIS